MKLWQGQLDSNQRMSASKTDTLPLGYTPISIKHDLPASTVWLSHPTISTPHPRSCLICFFLLPLSHFFEALVRLVPWRWVRFITEPQWAALARACEICTHYVGVSPTWASCPHIKRYNAQTRTGIILQGIEPYTPRQVSKPCPLYLFGGGGFILTPAIQVLSL